MNRKHNLQKIHTQLEYWQENLAQRVAGEAIALADEIDKLEEQEMDRVETLLHQAQDQIMTGCDLVRNLRRRLQDQPGP